MAVWSTPDILVLHLKRFEYRNVFWRDKLNTFVDFPLLGLDMSKYAQFSQHDFLAAAAAAAAGGEGESSAATAAGAPPATLRSGASDVVYDLFAVVNHMGSMAGGHYTAFANSAVGRGFVDDLGQFWHEFNDSSVSRVAPHEVVSRFAYVLFYRRRLPGALRAATMVA